MQSADNEKASEFLIEAFDKILQRYKIQSVSYVNTPGSFAGIKQSYVILKTLSLVLNFDIYAVCGFELNEFSPIRANKNFSFVYKDGKILLEKAEPKNLKLPTNLSKINKNSDILPVYVIGAI